MASITLTAADWLDHADALLACQPIEEVTMPAMPAMPAFISLGASPEGCWHYLMGPRSMRATWVPSPAPQNDVVATLLHAIWPRITFSLAPLVEARWDVRPRDIRRDLETIRRHAESRLGYEPPAP